MNITESISLVINVDDSNPHYCSSACNFRCREDLLGGRRITCGLYGKTLYLDDRHHWKSVRDPRCIEEFGIPTIELKKREFKTENNWRQGLKKLLCPK
ncbi:hypothetical protein JW977_03595 [Candidatus Falkowbacteria bacterium]|nr:hypothetical protein [Candidatus Falkowbacteria bacterium]